MVLEIVDFLSSHPTPSVWNGNRASWNRGPVLYAVCNHFGSITVVHESKHVVRKSNVVNHTDSLVPSPVAYFRQLANSNHPCVTVLVFPETLISLMYCHRVTQRIFYSCRKVFLIGEVSIVFADPRVETEEWLQSHLKTCNGRCAECSTSSLTFRLQNKDILQLKGGRFFIRVSGNRHSIYMSKSQFQSNVQYISCDKQSNDSLLAFVNEIPDKTK